MRLMLDTQALLWMLESRSKLGPLARSVIDSAPAVIVADASLWEIAVKVSIGKLTVEANIARLVRQLGFERPLTTDVYCETLAGLPLHHRDPFDRMLVAQALSDDLTVVTSDPLFAQYGVRVIDASE
jgi:PIN domain nuclease of toxin-antitoxin system